MKNESGAAITDVTHIANVNPIRYRGYFYDTETKLYYCNSRYYDPQVKRFINAEPSVKVQIVLTETTAISRANKH